VVYRCTGAVKKAESSMNYATVSTLTTILV